MAVGVLAGSELAQRAEPRRLVASDDVTEVCEAGWAVVRGALTAHDRWTLLQEAAAARDGFLTLPKRINGVRQQADQLTVRIGDPAHRSLNGIVGELLNRFAGCDAATGVGRFFPSEARYMRYLGGRAGLGAHRDGKCYSTIVCVFSVAGTAPFTVYGGPDVRPFDGLVFPGDLVLLRAPGLGDNPDGRPRHAVGAPLEGERISLTLRMSGGCA